MAIPNPTAQGAAGSEGLRWRILIALNSNRKLEILNLSDEPEIDGEVERAAHALDAMISTHLAAGANRCVLAAACVWGGVKEMSEITNSQSAAAALRTIADEIDPPVDVPRSRIAPRADDALMVAVREHGWNRGAAKQKPADDPSLGAFNQEMASDVVGEAIDLIDQAQPALARALLMALRARLVASPRPPATASRRRWGG
jgi:hypothetical protein